MFGTLFLPTPLAFLGREEEGDLHFPREEGFSAAPSLPPLSSAQADRPLQAGSGTPEKGWQGMLHL